MPSLPPELDSPLLDDPPCDIRGCGELVEASPIVLDDSMVTSKPPFRVAQVVAPVPLLPHDVVCYRYRSNKREHRIEHAGRCTAIDEMNLY